MSAPPITERHKPHFHRNAPWRESVRVATTATATLASAFENGDTIDGVTLVTGDRVLLKDQSTGSQNGIYTVNASGAPTRAYDVSTDDPGLGWLVYVREGTANGGKSFRCTNITLPTIGSTALVFSEIVASSSTSFGTPATTYGTSAAGAASTAIRTDAVLPGPPIIILTLTNKSGGSVAAGDVVVIDTANDTAFTTTTTGQAEVSVGIAQATIANNASGAVLVAGYAALVNVPSSMTRGRYLETHTVAKQATGSATRRAGSFGQFVTSGSTPSAWIWGQTDQTASGGGSSLTVEEVDGSPTDSAVTKIVFPNGTLGIVSHVATYTPTGGGAPTFDGCRIFNSANVALTNGAETAITFDSERYDTSSYHSTVSNTDRITIPTTGKYHVGASVQVTSASGNPTYMVLRVGTTGIAATAIPEQATGNFVAATLSTDYAFTAGDIVRLYVFVNAGSKNAIFGANFSPEAWCHFLGA